jgi:hypothetical protein
VAVLLEIKRKQAAARQGASYEAEQFARANATWAHRTQSSQKGEDQEGMAAALAKLGPLISTKVRLQRSPHWAH